MSGAVGLLLFGFVAGVAIGLLANYCRRLQDKVADLTDDLDETKAVLAETETVLVESRDLVDHWRGRHHDVERALLVQVARAEGMSFSDIAAAYSEVLDRESEVGK